MAARKSGLGKGLDSLIPNRLEETREEEKSAAVSSAKDGHASGAAAKKTTSVNTGSKTDSGSSDGSGSKTSDTKDSGTKASGTKSSGTKATGTKAPGIKASETKSSGTKAAETKTSESETSGSKASASRSSASKTSGSKASASGSSASKPSGAKTTAAKAEAEEAEDKNIQFVPIEQVEPNREQPRKQFEADALQELAESIKIHGVLQPLLVSDREDYYEIIAGERRWRAAKAAGLKEIPVIVRDLSEGEIVEISLIENIQREDLNPIEEARAYDRLLTEFHLKQEEVAQRVSKSRSAVTNSLRLLRLHPEVQEMLIRAELSAGHARALLAVEDSERQLELAQNVVMNHLSVRDVEKLVKKAAAEKKPPKKPETNPVLDAIYRDIAENMRQILGTRVEIHPKKDMGKIEIEYYSQDELNRILELFQSIENE